MTGMDARTQRFRDLHREGCFVMPNPWDIGTARYFRSRGFPALATTSLGFAFSQGRADQDVPLEMMLAHIGDIVAAVPDIPVNADFENAYADEPEAAAANILRCAATGVAGVSIEDGTGRAHDPLYDFDLAVARVAAARQALDAAGSPVMLTARAECYLTGHPKPLEESARRLRAYADAGADVLYAPGPRTLADMRVLVDAAQGKPVNMLLFGDFGLHVADVAAAGVRRISVGGAMARIAWSAIIGATDAIVAAGAFTGFASTGPSRALDTFFAQDRRERDEHDR